MFSNRRHFASAALGLLACGRKRGTGYPGYAFVANQDGNALAVVDLIAFAVARYIPLGAAPTQVLCHPRSGQVYALTPGTGTLHLVDPLELKVTRQVRMPRGVTSMHLTPDPSASALLLVARGERQLWKASPAKLDLHYSAALPEEPTYLDCSNWTGLILAGNAESGRGHLLDLATGKAVGTVETGSRTSAMLFRSDGRQIWVAHPDRRQVAGFLASTGQTVARLPLALTPDTMFAGPDGGSLFVTGPDRDALAIVEPYPAQVASTLPVGPRPGAMAASIDPPYLFLASRDSSQVSVVDMQLRKVIAVTATGNRPSFIKVTPDQQYALVIHSEAGEMAVLRTTGIRAQRQKAAALFTIIPLGSKPVSADVSRV